jgi:hypothetical protein
MPWLGIYSEFVVAAAELLDEGVPCVDDADRAESFQRTEVTWWRTRGPGNSPSCPLT